MDLLSFLKSEQKRREAIVDRLLSQKQITSSEAILLLKKIERININKVEISSGAKVVMGDDNQTNNQP